MSSRLLILPVSVALTFLLSGCDPVSTQQSKVEGAAGSELAVSSPSIRLNPNKAAPSAAYFTLTGGASNQVLTGVSSPDLERADLHESKMEGGMMSMAALSQVPVPAGGSVEFRQGGKHVMLFGISDAARAAGKLTLTLAFESGQAVPVEVPLTAISAADAGDEHAGH